MRKLLFWLIIICAGIFLIFFIMDYTNKDSDYQTYKSSATAWFDGTSTINYQFQYPKSLFDVEKSFADDTPNDLRIIWKKKNTESAFIHVSYEGGRGFTPLDYWEEIGKPKCARCQIIPNIVTIAGVPDSDIRNFIGPDKEVIIFSRSPWLFVIDTPVSIASEVEKIISTFTF